MSFYPGKDVAQNMKTPAQRFGLRVLLLIGIGVTWLKLDVYSLEAVAAWVQHLGSQGPFMLAGLYGLSPTLHLRGAVPPMAGEALCGAILGRALMLMGTTIGALMACLMARYLVGVLYCVGSLFGRIARWCRHHPANEPREISDRRPYQLLGRYVYPATLRSLWWTPMKERDHVERNHYPTR